MARTLEQQHKRERDYYLGKTDKLDGKTVAERRKEYRESAEDYEKKLSKIQERARDKARSTVKDDRKLQPVSTVVTYGVIDEVKPNVPEVEKTAVISNTAQGTGKAEKSEPATPEVEPSKKSE